MSDGPSCAHLHAEWRTRKNHAGSSSGWWECAACGTPFIPEPLHEHLLQKAKATRAEAEQMATAFKQQAITASCEDCRSGREAIHASNLDTFKDMKPPVDAWFHIYKAGEKGWTQDVLVHCTANHLRRLPADSSALAEALRQARLEEAEWWAARTPVIHMEPCRCVECQRVAALRDARAGE